MPMSSSSTPARSSRKPSRRVSTPSSTWPNGSTTARCHTLIVSGCLPQRYQEELAKELPEVDIFIGTGDYPRIAEILAEKSGTEGQLRYIGDPDFIYDEELPRLNSSPAWFSYLKIGEGCSNCCSYCIIPKLRGAYRSRPIDALVAEAERLVARGVKEINVISQDITRYGSDMSDGTTLEIAGPSPGRD